MTETIQYGDLTSDDFRQAVEEGVVVVVPLGATEQHGPHLPLDTDWRLSSYVAEQACATVGESGITALATPPLWLGYSPHHMEFAGTLSLGLEPFLGVVTSIGTSLWGSGVRKIVFLNGHGGNANLMRAALQELRFRNGVRAVGANYWDFAADLIPNWRQSDRGGINHACEMETSLMLACRPGAVRTYRIEDATWFPASPFISEDLTIAAPVSVNWSHAELDASGVLGDPTVATAEHGQELLDHIIGEVAKFLVDFAGWDWDDPRAV